jgi:hypothetical protein
MARKRWLTIFIFLALSGCQVLPGFFQPAPTAAGILSATPTLAKLPTQTPAPTITPTKAPVVVPPWIASPKTLEENSTKPSYTIQMSYPEIGGTKDPNLLAFNQAAEKLAKDTLADFRKDFTGIPLDPSFGSSFAQMNYSVLNGTDGLLSVRFNVSFYASGAAHPNSYSQTLNFDLIHGKPIELSQVFLPKIDYLKLVATLCTTDLTQQKRLEFLEGVQPVAENFARWNISSKGLVFSFDPYQVASYAMGPSQVTIPYAALAGSIDPNGLLAPLLK